LERYTAVFKAVEINSALYRPHRSVTYERPAASVPDSFRFAVLQVCREGAEGIMMCLGRNSAAWQVARALGQMPSSGAQWR
jgi:hypothetical protein